MVMRPKFFFRSS